MYEPKNVRRREPHIISNECETESGNFWFPAKAYAQDPLGPARKSVGACTGKNREATAVKKNTTANKYVESRRFKLVYGGRKSEHESGIIST